MRWHTKVRIGINIQNRNQHCQRDEPYGQNKMIEQHLLRMKKVGLVIHKSVFVLLLCLEPLADLVIHNAQEHRLCKIIVTNNEMLALEL